MPNYEGNPRINEYGKDMHFGQPNAPCPRAAQQRASEPWSIQKAVRRLMAAEFDISPDAPDLHKQMLEVFGGKNHITGAQYVAVTKFTQALKNPRAMETLIDRLEGKVVERKAEAQVTLADLVNASYQIGNEENGG